jgi:hypothetical protein
MKGERMTKPRVYFDTTCFIDVLSKQKGITLKTPERDKDAWYCQMMLSAAIDGKVEVCTSLLTGSECTAYKNEKNERVPINDEMRKKLDSIFFGGSGGILSIQPQPWIIERARDLDWNHGIYGGNMDRLHIASALDRECTELWTMDIRKPFDQKTELAALGIKVIFPRETTQLPETYKQDDLPNV